MTKHGSLARGPISNRPSAKRREARLSRGSLVGRSLLINDTDENGLMLRKVAILMKDKRYSLLRRPQTVARSENALKIKSISAEASSELSFRMLSTLDIRMKEEDFDAFE
ncbi:hypothetical protein [Enterobacter sp.]|uniref:hypothetical protein n=1 Tax=Enterobacter sp. TaxID=42895 RepID=UPI00296F1ACD|nr:hypothetical protein [Enterobacter sp.]